MNGPISFSAIIRSWKSGIMWFGFSGSFLSIQDFQESFWFLPMDSGSSLKNARPSFPGPKECLESANTFSHPLSAIKVTGLALSFLISKAAPDFKKILTSAAVIRFAVYNILKHIIRIKVILSFSKSPLFTYL